MLLLRAEPPLRRLGGLDPGTDCRQSFCRDPDDHLLPSLCARRDARHRGGCRAPVDDDVARDRCDATWLRHGDDVASGASTDHDCSNATRDTCCDDCLCAGPIGTGAGEPVIVLVATYAHVATEIEQPTEVVRSHHQPALRLPPPLGPPLITRS